MIAGRRLQRRGTLCFTVATAAMLGSCAVSPDERAVGAQALLPPDARCVALAEAALADSPVDGLAISAAHMIRTGTPVETRGGEVSDLPDHCLVEGRFAERQGTLGQTYAIGFRMRLPTQWNGRFFFEGGGGSNGVVRDATGFNGAGNPLGLARGYAVIAQDSGHDNETNTLPDHQGDLVFGFDPEARRNYGHASLEPVNKLAHHLLRNFYGEDSRKNVFWGCSKGGQEGMAFAQRYPDAFDGIVAMAPGMSLPRAALAQTWDTQALASIAEARGESLTVSSLKTLLQPADYSLIAEATLAACDRLDGTQDGIIGAVGQCTTERVLPELRKRELTPEQIEALVTIMNGPHDSSGNQLYAPWAWDSGIASPGWAAWKTGLENGPPSLNVVLGAGSLAAVFTTPPTALTSDPAALLAWQLGFDFDRDAAKIYAVAPPYTSSPWQDVGMRSTDLSAFRKHGGKLIVPHGVSDPVFSVLDTIDWWQAVDEEEGGTASSFVRVFPVPGMNHCSGGPATDRFDSLSALERWIESDEAPTAITATAGESTPWPGRTMPLCPYPQVATRGEDQVYRCQPSPEVAVR